MSAVVLYAHNNRLWGKHTMKFSKNRGLDSVANVVLFQECGIADLQLTGKGGRC